MSYRNLELLSNRSEFSDSRRSITKIAIIGDSGVGKTSLLERFTKNSFKNSYIMTIGGNFLTKKLPMNNGKSEILIFSDVAGQERFKEVRQVFYSGVEIVLAVCDLTRKNTLLNLDKVWLPEFLHSLPTQNANIKVQLIGNKCDLEDLSVISSRSLEKMAHKLSKKYPHITLLRPALLTSAKDNIFLEDSKTTKEPLAYCVN